MRTDFDESARAADRGSFIKLVVAAALVLTVMAFIPTWLAFPPVWQANRSYGFLAAGFSAWLLWQERHHFGVHPELDGLRLLAASVLSLGWFFAIVLSIQVVHMALVPWILVAWVWSVSGSTAGRAALRIALLFMLAVPLWEVLLTPLQLMTVTVNSMLVRAAGIAATLDGNHIIFPRGTIEVAQSCAGLSYFMSALTISVLYARLSLKSRKMQVIAVAIACGLAIISNWFRVFGLVVVGYRSEMQSPLLTEHSTYGWIIFSVSLVVFFSMARTFEKRDAQIVANAASPTPSSPDTDTATTPATPTVWWPVAVATGAAIIGPVLFFGLRSIPAQSVGSESTIGIAPPANWRMQDRVVTEAGRADTTESAAWRPGYDGASVHFSEQWSDSVQQVQVDRMIYASQTQQGELIGGHNNIASPSDVFADGYAGPLDDRLRTVRQAIVRTPDGPRLVWYWFRVSGIETPLPEKAKFLELLTFVTRGPPSELIAVSTLCAADNCQDAGGTVSRFVTGRDVRANP